MFRYRLGLVVAAVCGFFVIVPRSQAQLLFAQDFDFDSTGDWVVNNGPGTNSADFFFDYSTVGIPTAPNSLGTTRGLKLQANVGSATFGGLSVSPFGLSLSGDYLLSFDYWMNVNGPFPVGGNGSTQAGGAGIGTAGASPQWAGGSQDSVWFATTGDGNSSADYRAYSTAAGTSYPDASPVYAAGGRNGSLPYYSSFGNVTAPVAQLTLFPQQTGNTGVGAIGMGWHDIEIEKSGNTVVWRIDGLIIATIDLTTVTLAGTNIHFNYFDTNTASSSDPNAGSLLFGLVDNVLVTQIPEPSSALLAALGLAGLSLRRRRG